MFSRIAPRFARVAIFRPATKTNHIASFSALASKRAAFSTRHENDPEKLESLKQESLKDQYQERPEWKEGLATDAEAFVKETRGDTPSADKDIPTLQAESVDTLQSKTEDAMNEKAQAPM